VHHASAGKRAKQATRSLPEEDPEFQIAPMIDILLVLLVFFMSISSTEVLQTNEAVRLPVAKDGKKIPEDKDGMVTVNVLWNPLNSVGSIEVDGRTYYVAQELAPVIQQAIQRTPNARIFVRADKEVRYDYLRSILKIAGTGGITNITFSVVNRENE
jgi:biopolymer transport protein ExbD